MKIVKVPFDKIQYLQKEVSQDLMDSLLRISFAFPIKVRKVQETFECIDGHKRLNAVAILSKNELYSERFQMIPVVFVNDTRTDNDWSRMRHH